MEGGWRSALNTPSTALNADFLLLGPLEIREGGRALPLGGAKQRALLAVLLLHANEVVSRDRLIDDLWGENPAETAVEERIEADLSHGRHAELVAELERLIAQHPLRERLRSQLMLALYRSGRQAEALEAYQAARRMLVDELGIEPGALLQRLEKAVLVQDPALDPAAPAATAGESPSSAFVGREPELAELLTGLDDAFACRGRLFLLVGEPGIGKSRRSALPPGSRARDEHEAGARPWLAHTQDDYARMLLARAGPGDRERAQELLDAALATYRELGMETARASGRP
jgi:tetratricopeptide (TPR) repeat protein